MSLAQLSLTKVLVLSSQCDERLTQARPKLGMPTLLNLKLAAPPTG